MNNLLSKEVVLKHLGMAMECEDCPRKGCKDIKLNAVEVCSIIRYLATFADVQRGKWEIPVSVGNGIHFCSICRNEAYWDTSYGQQLFDYCPYCGADMRGEGNG